MYKDLKQRLLRKIKNRQTNKSLRLSDTEPTYNHHGISRNNQLAYMIKNKLPFTMATRNGMQSGNTLAKNSKVSEEKN